MGAKSLGRGTDGTDNVIPCDGPIGRHHEAGVSLVGVDVSNDHPLDGRDRHRRYDRPVDRSSRGIRAVVPGRADGPQRDADRSGVVDRRSGHAGIVTLADSIIRTCGIIAGRFPCGDSLVGPA